VRPPVPRDRIDDEEGRDRRWHAVDSARAVKPPAR
jgi:hypothetical protein